MSRQSSFRIACCVLAIAVFGAVTVAPCFAQKSGAAAPAPDTAAEQGNSPARSSQDAPGATGTENNSSVPNGGENNAIDTRVTVSPHRHGDARDKAGKMLTAKTVAPRNLLARQPIAHGVSEPPIRNAIGATMVRPEGFGQRIGERGNFSTVTPNPALGANTNGISKTGPIANFGRPIGRPTQNANPIVKSIVPTHGGINGTDLTRHASSPARIGGRTISAGGISGTSIRPKHSAGP